MKIKTLKEMKRGECGLIIDIQGGHNLISRLHNMGLRTGKKIEKVGAHFWHGPTVVRVGRIQIVVGYGMAQKIMVEVDS